MNEQISSKENKLEEEIKKLGKVIIAFSGGVDSSFLLKFSVDVLGKKNVIAVTLDHPGLPKSELLTGKYISKVLGVKHLIVKKESEHYKDFLFSPENRCYICKKNNFIEIKKIAEDLRIKNIIDGTNYSDDPKTRPGMKSLKELGIISPLRKAKLFKEEVRQLSKLNRMPNFNNPPLSCFYTRINTGEEITAEKLNIIRKGEEFLFSLGFKNVRLRIKEGKGKVEDNEKKNIIKDKNNKKVNNSKTEQNVELFFIIEVSNFRKDIEIIAKNRKLIVKKLKGYGVTNLSISLGEYKSY